MLKVTFLKRNRLHVLFRLITLVSFISYLFGCYSDPSKENVNDAPDIAIFYVSGHSTNQLEDRGKSYLEEDSSAGVAITKSLRDSGRTVAEHYYIDDAVAYGDYGGYFTLLDVLELVNDKWTRYETKIILVAHSHGAVWTHSAVQQLPSVPVFGLIDLDASSYDWDVGEHHAKNTAFSGDPRSNFYIPHFINDPTSEKSADYDIEDVIFDNVQYALEVRSGDGPEGVGYYDEKRNIRTNGSFDRLWYEFTNTSHAEVYDGYGSTISHVSEWILNRLAENE